MDDVIHIIVLVKEVVSSVDESLIRSTCNNTEILMDYEHPQSPPPPDFNIPDLSKDYFCRLCEFSLHSDKEWQLHIASKYHILRFEERPLGLAKHRKFYDTDEETNASKILKDANYPIVGLNHVVEYRVLKLNDPVYTCFLCHLAVSMRSLANHLKSSKHYREYIKRVDPVGNDMISFVISQCVNMGSRIADVLVNIINDRAKLLETMYGRGSIKVEVENTYDASSEEETEEFPEPKIINISVPFYYNIPKIRYDTYYCVLCNDRTSADKWSTHITGKQHKTELFNDLFCNEIFHNTKFSKSNEESLIVSKLNNSSFPVVGLQFVTEYRRRNSIIYTCSLCRCSRYFNDIFCHITSFKHMHEYIKIMGPIRDEMTMENYKIGLDLDDIAVVGARLLENKYGRGEIKVKIEEIGEKNSSLYSVIYCKFCKSTVRGVKDWQCHINENRHQYAIKSLLSEPPKPPNFKFMKPFDLNRRNKSTGGFSCKLCDCFLDSEYSFRNHVSSVGHMKHLYGNLVPDSRKRKIGMANDERRVKVRVAEQYDNPPKPATRDLKLSSKRPAVLSSKILTSIVSVTSCSAQSKISKKSLLNSNTSSSDSYQALPFSHKESSVSENVPNTSDVERVLNVLEFSKCSNSTQAMVAKSKALQKINDLSSHKCFLILQAVTENFAPEESEAFMVLNFITELNQTSLKYQFSHAPRLQLGQTFKTVCENTSFNIESDEQPKSLLHFLSSKQMIKKEIKEEVVESISQDDEGTSDRFTPSCTDTI